jgi:cobalt-zinc-cadmium efflux system membrane fusion protein
MVFTFQESVMSGLLKAFSSLVLIGHLHAFAQTPTPPRAKTLALNAQQQAALGIQLAPVQAALGGLWLASATVSVPPGKEVTVTAPYPGVVTRIDAGLGDTVQAGTALATWSSPMLADARRQTREAQLEAQTAQAALQRDQALLAEGVIPAARLQLSQNKFQAAEAARLAREAELRSAGTSAANADYASATVRSPLTGSVVDVAVSVGQRVETGAVLFRVADTRQLQLDLVLSADKAAQLKSGDTVSVPSRSAKAVLIGVGRAVDTTQQARARARVTVPGSLRAGEVLSVQLHPSQAPTSAAAWQVPARAVVTQQGQSWVFVTTTNGFLATPVQVLSSNDDQSVIQASTQATLQASSRVAVTGLASLRALLQKDE